VCPHNSQVIVSCIFSWHFFIPRGGELSVLKILHLIFSAIASIATLSLAALAFYGAFFTDLPEAIITQLRLEVTETREQVIDLTRERRNLISEIDKARGELLDVRDNLTARERELQFAANDLNRKKIEIEEQGEKLNKLKEGIIRINEAREVYLNSAYEVVFSNLSKKIREKLLNKLADAEKLRNIKPMRDWFGRQEVVSAEIKSAKEVNDIEKMGKLIKKNIDSIPKSWRQLFIMKWSRDATPEERELKKVDIFNRFIEKSLKYSRKNNVTGQDIFKESVFETDLSIFLLEDRNLFLINFEKEIYSNGYVLNKTVNPVIFEGWDDGDIKENSEIVIGNINLILKKVDEFRESLRFSSQN
tara:strand:+ start:264 stop:1343 length:1080 start_codon:yes stop_codon:yes gene_type:complete